MKQTVTELALVSITIDTNICPLTVQLIISTFTLVAVSIRPSHHSSSVSHPVTPFPLVTVAIGPGHDTEAVRLSVAIMVPVFAGFTQPRCLRRNLPFLTRDFLLGFLLLDVSGSNRLEGVKQASSFAGLEKPPVLTTIQHVAGQDGSGLGILLSTHIILSDTIRDLTGLLRSFGIAWMRSEVL